MRRVGLIDITVGNATRLGAPQRSATRRCASQHIATQRLSRWGSPAARARLARTSPSIACGSETPTAASRRLKPRRSDSEGASCPTSPDLPVHTGGPLLRRVQIALKPASKALGLHGVFKRGKARKYLIADSAFKRLQVDAPGLCWLDANEHHLGLALQTGGGAQLQRME